MRYSEPVCLALPYSKPPRTHSDSCSLNHLFWLGNTLNTQAVPFFAPSGDCYENRKSVVQNPHFLPVSLPLRHSSLESIITCFQLLGYLHAKVQLSFCSDFVNSHRK
jgi:hypothetical protein